MNFPVTLLVIIIRRVGIDIKTLNYLRIHSRRLDMSMTNKSSVEHYHFFLGTKIRINI